MTGLAIHYRRHFFGETTSVVPAGSARAGIPRGLVGRQVANAEMLSALLRYGSDEVITFLVDSDDEIQELRSTIRQQMPADKKAIKTGERVRVVEVRGGDLLVVEKV